MIEEGHFHEELRKSTGLDVVVIGFGNTSYPGIWRAVGGNVKVKGLENNTLPLEYFILLVSLFSHKDKLVDTTLSKVVILFT
jgi:hypothetical protein